MSTTEEDVQNHVNLISAALPVTDTKSKPVADETEKDVELQQVTLNMNMDLFRLKGRDYLVVTDYYSNLPEVASHQPVM